MNWELYGSYTAWEPGRRLGFTWRWRHEPDVPPTAVLVTFAPLDTSGTSLTIQHGPYAMHDDDQERREGHREGWTHFCAKLHELAPGYSM